jgi:protein-S-isoprenylcysteine O-methyltransferase Ste14
MHHRKADTAGLPLPPPFIVLGFLIAGSILSAIFPIDLLPIMPRLILGVLLISIGLFIASRAIRLMMRAGTPVDPFEPTSAIVREGPYRFSRNPIYLGLALAYLGIASALNAVCAIALWPIMLIALTDVVIVREEKYLEGKFGEAYKQYKSKVRRWI